MTTAELLDLVSPDDTQVIDCLTRDEVYRRKLNNFRVVNALIINDRGQLWIPTRHLSKTLFPGALDCSVGGHVQSGESYQEAFYRESLEETGIDPQKTKHQPIAKLTPSKDGVSAFMQLYVMHWRGKIRYNENDFEGYSWLSPVEVLDAIKQGKPAKGDLETIIKVYIEYEKNSNHLTSHIS